MNRIPRRRLLQGTAAMGALLVGTGSASANGTGGQAIIHKDHYHSDETFEIHEVPDEDCEIKAGGSCRDDSLVFQCRGKGGGIPFPWWYLEYEGGPSAGEQVRLYTRDNSIRTGITYRWSRKSKDCPETEDYFQVGFVADR